MAISELTRGKDDIWFVSGAGWWRQLKWRLGWSCS